jgi:hypothetical protein
VRKTRQQLRAEAREAAKLLLQTGKPKQALRWDYSLFFIGVVIGIVLVVAPPRTRLAMVFWLIIMFGSLVYPLLHLVRAALQTRMKSARVPTAIILSAILVSAVGYSVWPPIRRHTLSDKERALFEKPLSEQKGPREEIQITCSQGDEAACVYANQFVNIFREAGWRVRDNHVERVLMSNPTGGIFIFKRGTGKLNPDDWRSGLWTALTLSFVNVRQAFVNLGIEPESGSNPEMPEGVITVYFGSEKDAEGAPTVLTDMMKRAERQWRDGTVPRPK